MMFGVEKYKGSEEEQTRLVINQLKALLDGEDDRIANLSNATALLKQFLNNINWVGFYLLKGEQLVLGPFQGLPACVRIPLGRGVCGTAASKMKTVRVADVNQFPGHIACDAASRSEIVIPIIIDDQLVGVLDIDSPDEGRFNEKDQEFLEEFVDELIRYI